MGRDMRSPFWLERTLLESYWEFDRQFQKTEGRLRREGKQGKVNQGKNSAYWEFREAEKAP